MDLVQIEKTATALEISHDSKKRKARDQAYSHLTIHVAKFKVLRELDHRFTKRRKEESPRIPQRVDLSSEDFTQFRNYVLRMDYTAILCEWEGMNTNLDNFDVYSGSLFIPQIQDASISGCLTYVYFLSDERDGVAQIDLIECSVISLERKLEFLREVFESKFVRKLSHNFPPILQFLHSIFDSCTISPSGRLRFSIHESSRRRFLIRKSSHGSSIQERTLQEIFSICKSIFLTEGWIWICLFRKSPSVSLQAKHLTTGNV